MQLGTETGSLVNHLLANRQGPAPEVGMGCTILYWSDRAAATVIEVNNAKRYIVIQEDTATRVDNNGMSDAQQYTYAANPDGMKRIFRKKKNGHWVEHFVNPTTGRLIQTGGCSLILGRRDSHYDYSF